MPPRRAADVLHDLFCRFLHRPGFLSCLMRNRLPCDIGSRCPAPQICQAAAGDGSVLSWSPWTVDECDCPRLFFRPERIHGLRARITRQGREKSYADHDRHRYLERRWTLIGFQITNTSRLRMAERAIRPLSAG